MALTVNGISVTIAENGDGGGISESVAENGPQATVQFKCAYADRWTVIKGLMGSVTSVGGTIIRTPPIPYPPLPTLFVTSIGTMKGLRPIVDGTGWLAYDEVIIPANFTLPQWNFEGPQDGRQDPSGLPYTTTRFRTSSEIFSPPGGSYFFPDGKPITDSGVGFVRSRVEITMTRHMMPYPPLNASLFLQGTINDAPITLADYEFPIGTLLYLGMESPEPKAEPSTGALTYDLTFNFLGNYVLTWNEYMKHDGLFYPINSVPDGSGQPPFFLADFSVFFSDNMSDYQFDSNRYNYM